MQMKIWSGEVDVAVNEHVETCADCRREQAEVQAVLGGIQALDSQAPQPTRSLQPSADLIRRTVRKNRLRRFWTSSSVAAGVTILLGTGVGLGLHALGSNGAEPAVQEQATATAPAVERKSAMKSSSSSMIPSTPPINDPYAAADSYKQASDYQVQVNAAATDSELCQSVAEFLQQSRLMGVQRVTILSAEPQQEREALVTLEIELRPGGVSLYRQGLQQAQVKYQQTEGKILITRIAPVQETKKP
jgi:hypothetical protein